MFTKRIIPCLDCKDGRVVKGTNFVDLRDAGDPVEVASMYDNQVQTNLYFLILQLQVMEETQLLIL